MGGGVLVVVVFFYQVRTKTMFFHTVSLFHIRSMTLTRPCVCVSIAGAAELNAV